MYTSAQLFESCTQPKINDISLEILREFYERYLYPFIYNYRIKDENNIYRELELRFDIDNFCHLVGLETIVKYNVNQSSLYEYKGKLGWDKIRKSEIDFAHLKNLNKERFKSMKAKFVYFYLVPKLIEHPKAILFNKEIVVPRTNIECEVLFYDIHNNAVIHLGLGKSSLGNYYCPRTFFVEKKNGNNIGNKYIANQQEIRDIYNKGVKEVIHKQFYYKGRNLLLQDGNNKEPKEEKFDFEKYTECLSYKQFREAILQFHDYIIYLCDKRVDEYKVKNLAKNLLYNYLMEIERYNIASDDLKQVYFERLDQPAYKEDFTEAFETIINELEELRVQKIEVEDVRILEIKRYIKSNYQESLDLDEISKQFSFNYNYLSSYFSQRTKEGFSGYLNKIRIEHACELLRNSSLAIADISNKVGYSDHSYFCRVLKKTQGKRQVFTGAFVCKESL